MFELTDLLLPLFSKLISIFVFPWLWNNSCYSIGDISFDVTITYWTTFYTNDINWFLGGQYYVPRAYYTIDAEGHASLPVPLRRLRRSPSYNPYPPNYPGANANANAVANGCKYNINLIFLRVYRITCWYAQ